MTTTGLLRRLLLCAACLAFALPANSQNVPVAGFGTSLKFDGSDDFARIDNYNGPTGDFTIEFWVKPIDLVTGWRGFFGHQPGNIDTRGPSMWQNGDKWHCDLHQVGGGRFEVNIPNVFQTAGEWVHLAWVKNGTTMYYYRNGKQIYTRSAPANGNYVTTNKLFFGYVDNHFNANFDEVRIWNVARTRDQINDYRFRNLDNTTGLLHYYPLDEGSGTTINDAIGGKNGILSGGPTFESAGSAPPITTPEDTPVSSYAKGSDVNGDALTFAFTSNGTKGTATFTDAATGAYTYSPNANENGADSFQYTVTDKDGSSTPAATVNVTITAVNDAPTGQDDHYHVAEDGVLTLSGTSILDNDVDLDGDHLTATLVTDVSNGTLVLDQNGTFTYTPTANYNGTDSFTYKPNDGTSSAAAASTVSIRVDPVNDPPITMPDAYSTLEDTTLSVKLLSTAGVLNNDRDPDGNPISAVGYTAPSNGTLTTNGSGEFTYTPNLNFNGIDSFTYRASDGSASSAPETVTITVRAANDDPVVHDDSYSVPEDGILKVPASLGLLANDSDPDGDKLQVAWAFQGLNPALPSQGSLATLDPDGSFIYRPDANFNGTDSFQYVLTDGTSNIGYGTVRIKITAVNDAPVANDDLYTVAEDGLLDISSTAGPGNLLSNDSDTDNNTLFISLVSGPTSGALHLNGKHGDFQYKPNANFNGTDQFVYKISDGKLFSKNATVTINVHAENDSPVSQPDAYSVAQGGLLTVKKAKGLLANDTDADANTLYVQLTSGPAHGTLQMQLDGGFTYQHNGLNPVTDGFTYRSFDGAPVPGTPPSESGLGNEVTVTLNINRVNRAPLGASDSYTVKQDKPLSVFTSGGVLANDLDIDGDQMIALIASYPANGALGLNSDGSFSYQPQQGYTGTDSFTYRPMDGKEQGNVTTVTLDVQAVNTAPLLGADSYFAVATQPLTVGATNGVLSNDIDPEGHPLAVTKIGSAPANGSLQLNADGSFVYISGAGFNTSDTFSYYATDGIDEAGPATVTINEAPAQNQVPVTNPNTYSVQVNSTLQVSVAEGVLNNDSDPDGQLLTASLVSISDGSVNLATDGSFTFYAPANPGTVTMVYQVDDGICGLSGNCPIEQVTITITAEPAEPVPATPIKYVMLMALLIILMSLFAGRRQYMSP